MDLVVWTSICKGKFHSNSKCSELQVTWQIKLQWIHLNSELTLEVIQWWWINLVECLSSNLNLWTNSRQTAWGEEQVWWPIKHKWIPWWCNKWWCSNSSSNLRWWWATNSWQIAWEDNNNNNNSQWEVTQDSITVKRLNRVATLITSSSFGESISNLIRIKQNEV